MPRPNLSILNLLVALLFSTQAIVAAQSDSTTLRGEYEWSKRGEKGTVKAVFSPREDDAWDVSFHFSFRNQQHVYKGQAHGSLADGPFEGSVKNEDGKRTFVFEGRFKQGVFRGKHKETTPGRVNDGTLTLGQPTSRDPV